MDTLLLGLKSAISCVWLHHEHSLEDWLLLNNFKQRQRQREVPGKYLCNGFVDQMFPMIPLMDVTTLILLFYS